MDIHHPKQNKKEEKSQLPPPFRPKAGVFKEGYGHGPETKQLPSRHVEETKTAAPSNKNNEPVAEPLKIERVVLPAPQETAGVIFPARSQPSVTSANVGSVEQAIINNRPTAVNDLVAAPGLGERLISGVGSLASALYSSISSLWASDDSPSAYDPKPQNVVDSRSSPTFHLTITATAPAEEPIEMSAVSPSAAPYSRDDFIAKVSDYIAGLHEWAVTTKVTRPQRLPDPRTLATVIYDHALANGLDPVFCAAIAYTETDFGCKTKSSSSARGVFQLLTPAIKDVAKERTQNGQATNWKELKRQVESDYRENVKVGIEYLKLLHDRIDYYEPKSPERLGETARAYNAGLAASNKDPFKGQDYVESMKQYSRAISGCMKDYGF